MKTRFHGYISLGFILLAIVVAVFVAFRINGLLALGYGMFALLAFGTIIMVYCAKCPCKAHCAHGLPGLLASRIDRDPGPYSALEITLLITALTILLILPNLWLWHFLYWMLGYWLLILIAVFQIRKFVCKPCGNLFCPLNR
jgi:hypothetical protein